MSSRKRSSRTQRTKQRTDRPAPGYRKPGEAPKLTPPPVEKTVPPWSGGARPEKRMWIVAGALTLLALILRIPTLTTRSLWFDELHTWSDAFWIPPESHTHWLFYRIVSVFTDLFGRNALGLRFYSMVAGVIGVFIVTVWVWRLAGALPGFLAGFALAVSATHIDFSQEGRYYAPMVLFSAGALWSATEFFLARDWKRWVWLVVLAVFLWLGLTNHVTSTVLIGIMGLWMAGCLVATGWGRRLVARLVIGPKPAPKGRAILIGAIAVVAAAFVVWRGWDFFYSYIKRINFTKHTPNVEPTIHFLLWNLRRFGAAMQPGSVLGALAWIVYEAGFLGGLVWLFVKRPAWAVLVVGGIILTVFAVFAYPLSQPYAPKYIAFLYQLRMLAFAVGWAAAGSWAVGKIRSLSPERQEWGAAAVVGLVILIVSIAPLARHYGTAKTPIRNALQWIQDHGEPNAAIVSYGHTNYDIEYYAVKNKMNLGRFTVLSWPSESGRIDMGMIRAAVPKSGELYFLKGWPHDLPTQLVDGLKSEFVEAARFPSGEAKIYDSVVYQWKYGKATLRENRPIRWTGDKIATGKAVPFYSLYGTECEWEVDGGGEGTLSMDGKEIALKGSDGHTTRTARVSVAPGPHEWTWTPKGSGGVPSSIACVPAAPLQITIPGIDVSDRGYGGELSDAKFEGRLPLRFIKNDWVDYDVELVPGDVYALAFEGFESSKGPSFFEIRLDGRFAGVVGFDRRSGKWTNRAFAFRARRASTKIRVRLISEISDAGGNTRPGVGGAIDSVGLKQLASDTKPPADDRVPLEGHVVPLSPDTPAYAAAGSPDSVAQPWNSKPNLFETRILEGDTHEAGDGARLQIHFKPPYSGNIMSPPFRVVPGKILYLQIPVEVNQVYDIGATLFLVLAGQNGRPVQLFPSRGGLQDRIDWDYIYRTFEGPNRKRFTFFFTVPSGMTEAAVGVMMWPHPVPLHAPRMTITLGPPEAPQKNPDLLSANPK